MIGSLSADVCGIKKMAFYLSFRNFFALYIELNKNFGIKPILSVYANKGEIMIDLPFTQLIYTPSKNLTAQNLKENHALRNARLSGPPKGTAED